MEMVDVLTDHTLIVRIDRYIMKLLAFLFIALLCHSSKAQTIEYIKCDISLEAVESGAFSITQRSIHAPTKRISKALHECGVESTCSGSIIEFTEYNVYFEAKRQDDRIVIIARGDLIYLGELKRAYLAINIVENINWIYTPFTED